MPENKHNLIEVGDQLIISGDELELRTPVSQTRYIVKAKRQSFCSVWEIADFLAKLSGLGYEAFRLPGWLTATAAVFLEPGQTKATENQKQVAT